MKESNERRVSVASLLGVDAAKAHDLIGSMIIAAVIIIIVLSAAATIILGTHIYYAHVHRMTDAGYVLRTRDNGFLKGQVTEWIKEGTPGAKIEPPKEEKKEEK